MSDTIRKHKEYLFPAVAPYYEEPLALERGEGMYVWDEAGQRYLDCWGGVLTVSVGHANPAVVQAVVEQVKRLQHTSALYAHLAPGVRAGARHRSCGGAVLLPLPVPPHLS